MTDESDARFEPPSSLQDDARKRILKEQQIYKAHYDRNRDTNTKFEIGNIVNMSTQAVSTGESSKFQSKHRGPLVVTEVLPSDTYRVAQLREDAPGRRHASTAHASQLKIWRPNDADEESEPESDASDDEHKESDARNDQNQRISTRKMGANRRDSQSSSETTEDRREEESSNGTRRKRHGKGTSSGARSKCRARSPDNKRENRVEDARYEPETTTKRARKTVENTIAPKQTSRPQRVRRPPDFYGVRPSAGKDN